jgi:hypothetical protein
MNEKLEGGIMDLKRAREMQRDRLRHRKLMVKIEKGGEREEKWTERKMMRRVLYRSGIAVSQIFHYFF